ncbi:leucyl/phenylalanyl-tRNA--protein transferase [Sphingomonas ginkgonis]|uniref:Leucyl/phenylalanyl-tRNA--protein transferase n=1 Tax=Sphingomonas ginkgonis TaxID=2315330 RepID=A0A429V8L6_9SPHN|nr:leucyl/phenylalanyl-tRNA--protein transferase [Sphingomonas ginkgonis]RST30274.1 leucyl/phenylalanyl-tRNA--protein transferase [Sphingomonas ginkgonis]
MSALDPKLLLHGYAAGIFPMAESRTSSELFWVEPKERAVLPLDRFHLSRSLRKLVRSGRFTVTSDRAFPTVLAGCADREETWINTDIERAVIALHAAGHAHSVEVWDAAGALVGGLYGVKLRHAFFGESMFSRVRDASKVAIAWLVARLRIGGFTLLDCQFMTEHLASLGAVSLSRDDYARLLTAAVEGSGEPESLAEFTALDRLLEASGAADSPGAAGKVIAQLLGQTS